MHTESGEIRSLTGLRGLAALWVFWFHCRVLIGGTVIEEPLKFFATLGGDLGVDIFFVLSGFVLALNYPRAHESPLAWLGFLRKRLARIYPVHLVGLGFVVVATLLGYRYSTPLEGLFRSLTLTHGWSYPIIRTWNTVSWSVSAEWLAYILFPAIAVVVLRIRSPLVILGSIVLLDLGLWSVMADGPYGGTMAYGLVRIAAEFPAGVLLHRLWMLNKEKAPHWDMVALCAILLLIFGAPAAANHGYKSEFAAGAALPLAGLIVYALARGTGRFLAGDWWIRAGQISYAFYMIHGASLAIAEVYAKDTRWAVGAAVLTFLACVGLAWLIYEHVEKPARRLILDGFKSPRPRETQGAIAETP